MSTGPAELRLTVSGHWVNAWFMTALARPFVRVDGVEHPACWGRPTVLQLDEGTHVVEVFIRYRGSVRELGIGRKVVELVADDLVVVQARNGWANHHPFTLWAGKE